MILVVFALFLSHLVVHVVHLSVVWSHHLGLLLLPIWHQHLTIGVLFLLLHLLLVVVLHLHIVGVHVFWLLRPLGASSLRNLPFNATLCGSFGVFHAFLLLSRLTCFCFFRFNYFLGENNLLLVVLLIRSQLLNLDLVLLNLVLDVVALLCSLVRHWRLLVLNLVESEVQLLSIMNKIFQVLLVDFVAVNQLVQGAVELL